MAVNNINTPQRLGGFRAFADALRLACINSSQRIIEAGVKERGFINDGNPEDGSFRIGLKASPEETPSDITTEALAFANEVIVDSAVVSACVWGTMTIGTTYQDEVYAFVNVNIS